MIRKFLHWLLGESDTHLLLKSMIENQAKVTEAVMGASQKQSEVLAQYLDLFKSKDGEEPRVWTEEPSKWDEKDLEKMGYPSKATPAEQAEWVLDHIGKFEGE